MSEQNWNEYAFFGGIDPKQRQGCDEIFALLYGAIYFKKTEEILVQGTINKRKRLSPHQTDENNTLSVLQNYRDYGELAKQDIILRTENNNRDDTRLTGASIFPTDLGLAINSQHHPWACSLRTRGYRGRHRCGVTLLWGPRKDEPKTHE